MLYVLVVVILGYPPMSTLKLCHTHTYYIYLQSHVYASKTKTQVIEKKLQLRKLWRRRQRSYLFSVSALCLVF